MEVFTVVEHRVDSDTTTCDQRPSHPYCQFQVPFGIAVIVQAVITLGVTGILVWHLVDNDAARNILPVFGRLAVIICLATSFYFQKTIFSSHTEINENHLVGNMIFFVISLLAGVSFWLVQMQYASGISVGVANYSSVEPIIVITAIMIGFYCLRRIMSHYEGSKTEELDIYTKPLFPQLLSGFGVLEAVFGLVFAICMNLVVSNDHEYSKRCGCLLGIFMSAVVNELAIMFSKESRTALLVKTGGFFINLMCTQLTWWLSYYKERQLTLYGLGVGFLTLLFGVLYTVEMSLQAAQLNIHNPDNRIASSGAGFLYHGKKSGDLKKDNNEEVDSSGTDSQASVDKSGMKVLNKQVVIVFAFIMQVALCLLPVVVLLCDMFYPDSDPKKLGKDRIGHWCMWAVGFFASLLLNEVILIQDKMNYCLVSICNGAFCINFLVGCVLSYRGIRMSEEAGVPINFMIIASMWIPYFVLSHVDFVRLTHFSLGLERKQVKQRHENTQVSLFVASGIQSMVAVAAFLPTTDFVYFPGKIFSILTFPSMTIISEVIFQFGKTCRGPFLVTFTAFFLGAAYSQLVWYISVVLDGEEEFLGLTKPWLLTLGVVMGVLAFLYVLRFLYVILEKWQKTE